MLRSQADDEECAGEKEDGGGGEGNLYVERAPNESDQEAGEKIADGIDGGERAEGHAVLLLRDNLGGEGIFKRFFGADVEPRKDGGNALKPIRKDRSGRAAMGRSRTRSQKAATAMRPGKSVQRKTLRKEWLVTSRSQSAVSGPPMAPTVSIRRSRPNARP